MRTATLLCLLTASLSAPAGTVDRFALCDASGKTHDRSEWKDRKAIVLLFVGADCPVSNSYAPEMTRIARAYADRPVLFYLVYADADATAGAVEKHVEEYRLEMTALLDPKQEVAAQAGVKRVPTAVVLSPAGEVLYRGRIDDRFALDGKRREEPTTHELRDAIDAVLSDKLPPCKETQVFGCPLTSKEDGK